MTIAETETTTDAEMTDAGKQHKSHKTSHFLLNEFSRHTCVLRQHTPPKYVEASYQHVAISRPQLQTAIALLIAHAPAHTAMSLLCIHTDIRLDQTAMALLGIHTYIYTPRPNCNGQCRRRDQQQHLITHIPQRAPLSNMSEHDDHSHLPKTQRTKSLDAVSREKSYFGRRAWGHCIIVVSKPGHGGVDMVGDATHRDRVTDQILHVPGRYWPSWAWREICVF